MLNSLQITELFFLSRRISSCTNPTSIVFASCKAFAQDLDDNEKLDISLTSCTSKLSDVYCTMMDVDGASGRLDSQLVTGSCDWAV